MFGQESVANDISDYYGDKSNEKEVRQFCEVHNQVATTLFHQFVSSFDVCSNSAMMLAILFSLKSMEMLGNGLQPQSGASSQSCRSVDADAWCKRALMDS